MNKRLLRALVRKVREANILHYYWGWTGTPGEGGENFLQGHSCELCGGHWKHLKRENHKPKCMLAQGYRELGVQPPIIRR